MPTHTLTSRRMLLALLLGALGAASWFVPVASAAGGAFPAGFETSMAKVIGSIIIVMDVLTWILFTFLNYLLDPQFIFGVGGNLLTILNHIWQLARNLMNIIFAFALLGAAIYTIITAKKEFLSQYGGKFILAVILVNFSWFLPRVVIDVANVGASAVYGIPSLLSNQQAGQCWVRRTVRNANSLAPNWQCQPLNPPQPNEVQCRCMGVTDVRFFVTEADAQWLQQAEDYKCPLGTILCYKEEILDLTTTAPYSAVLNGLVINHARLAQLAQIPQSAAPAATSNVMKMVKYLIQSAIVLLIHIALFFPLLAMTVAFFIRIPVLWITIAFMPFYFLDFLLGGTGEQFTQGMGKKILTTFLKAAFLPLLVAVPLSIGLMLLNAGTQLTGGEIANLHIPLFTDIGNVWQLLWLCMALAVLWVGVFMVLKGDDILSTGAQSIKGFGESLGKIALKAPLAVPVAPFGGMSPLQLMTRLHPARISQALSDQPLDKEFLSKLLGGNIAPPEAQKAAKALHEASNKAELQQLQKLVATSTVTSAELQQIIKILNNRGFTGTDDSNVGTRLEQLQQANSGFGFTAAQIKNIQQAATKETNAKAAGAKKAGAGGAAPGGALPPP